MINGKSIPNNNKSIIRFLSKNFAKTKRVRNRILFCSVVISILAITTIFGIPWGKIKAEEIRLIRENGTAASGRIEECSEQQYEVLKNLDYIEQVGKSIPVGEVIGNFKTYIKGDAERVCQVAWVDTEAWNQFMKPAYTNITGGYPTKKQEILLSKKALKKLGISEPKQGMEIDLDVSIGLFEHSKEKFKLCGWYTDHCRELSIGYVSKRKVDSWNIPEDAMTLLFRQSNYLEQQKTEAKLYQDFPMKNNDQKITVSDTTQYYALSRIMGGYEMAVLGTLSILCGIYFLVRNVLWISMTEDIRNLGLLNTVGATEKQIAQIYRRQIRHIMLTGSILGIALAIILLMLIIPEIVGIHFLNEMGGRTNFYFFRPVILLLAVVFVNGILWVAADGIIRKIVKMSCIESIVYMGRESSKKIKILRKKKSKKRTLIGEMLYIASQNITLHKKRFVITCLSLFLGIISFLSMIVITKGSDYVHIIEKRPDFLIAGEFSMFGKSQGHGTEYQTRDINGDPLLTDGDCFALLYDNAYDEFSPISEAVKKKIEKIDGINLGKSNIIEGAYLNTMISKKGIRPYDEGITSINEGNMIEGFHWDTVQVLKEGEIIALKNYVEENRINIDMDSVENGKGVLILHEHMLTPAEQNLTDSTIGEPVYFKTMFSRKDAIRWNEIGDTEREEEKDKGNFQQKQSEVFKLCGYLDSHMDNFPEIHQSWHGAEGSLYFLISESGFQKIPTEKKVLAMELNVSSEREPIVKSKIQEIISEENNRCSKLTEVSMDEGAGEAGIFAICKSDLMKQEETYMRGNRILLGSVSIILLIAGLTNYFNVVLTGMYSRRKEFDIMQSIGMTDRQILMLIYGEGSYYFLFTMGLILTVGIGILLGIKVYMENKLSYFVFHWPIVQMVIIVLCFLSINIIITGFIWKKI